MADYQAVPIVTAAKQAGIPIGVKHNGLIITGSNCFKIGINAIKAGEMFGTATEDPGTISLQAAQYGTALLEGKKVPLTETVQEHRVDPSTLAQYRPSARRPERDAARHTERRSGRRPPWAPATSPACSARRPSAGRIGARWSTTPSSSATPSSNAAASRRRRTSPAAVSRRATGSACRLPNSSRSSSLYFGILRLGAIVVPQNPLATPASDRRGASDAPPLRDSSSPSDDERAGPRQDETPRRRAEPPAGGPGRRHRGHSLHLRHTGAPKGAELTHANLGRNARAAVEIYALTIDDVVLGVLPALSLLRPDVHAQRRDRGGRARRARARFDANRAAEAIGPTRSPSCSGCRRCSPTSRTAMRTSAPSRQPAPVLIGGAPLPAEVLEAFEARTRASAVRELRAERDLADRLLQRPRRARGDPAPSAGRSPARR